jgi:hypothetical protein
LISPRWATFSWIVVIASLVLILLIAAIGSGIQAQLPAWIRGGVAFAALSTLTVTIGFALSAFGISIVQLSEKVRALFRRLDHRYPRTFVAVTVLVIFGEVLTARIAVQSRPAYSNDLTFMDAGTLVHVRQVKGRAPALNCSIGFTLTVGTVRYATTSQRCLPTRASNVLTWDDKFAFAADLSCGQTSMTCLTANRASSGVGAFRPNRSQPTGRAQTLRDLLPVLREASTAELLTGDLAHASICHFGVGSANTSLPERCGRLVSLESTTGVGSITAYGAEGDDGGPVYVKEPDGSGVIAVGIVSQGTGRCSEAEGCRGRTYFVSMPAVEAALDARLYIGR